LHDADSEFIKISHVHLKPIEELIDKTACTEVERTHIKGFNSGLSFQ